MSSNQTDQSTTSLPPVVWALGAAIFLLGTTEFMIAGLLPLLAGDLGVSLPQAGLLISAFAVGMVVGAPAMAALTLRLPRRTTLIAALAVFAAGHVLVAVSTSYAVVLIARVVTAVATGAFWAIAAVVTATAVADTVRARALAVLVGGLTVANVAGVPLGTLLGQAMGWRAPFWTLAVAALIAAPVLALLLPAQPRPAVPPRVGPELRAFRNGRLWLALGTIAVLQAGVFGFFSYLAPLLTEVAGLPAPAVPAVLAGFGVGSLVGVMLGGRFGDARPWMTMFTGLGAAAVILAALAVTAGAPAATVVLVAALGVAGFALAAPLSARVITLAGAAPTLASATTTSAFNVGNAVGPWLGGIAISSAGLVAPAALGAVLVAAALGLALLSRRSDQRAAHSPAGDEQETACRI